MLEINSLFDEILHNTVAKYFANFIGILFKWHPEHKEKKIKK